MALGERQNGNRIYFSVADGEVVRRFKGQPDDPKAKERTTKKLDADGQPVKVWERTYEFIEGFVTGIEIGSSTFNGVTEEKAQWKIFMHDGDEEYVLTMFYSSQHAKRFINCAASIDDWNQKIRIRPYKMEDEKNTGKFFHGVTLYLPPYQKENKVPPAYPSDEYPKGEMVTFKGKERYDDTKQMLFWEGVVTNVILPKLQAVHGAKSYDRVPAEPVEDDGDGLYSASQAGVKAARTDEDFDDVPF